MPFQEGVISRKRVLVPVEVQFRQFLGEDRRVGASLVSILLKLDYWTESIQVSKSDFGTPTDASVDVIEHTAKRLTRGIRGTEQQIMMKSLQEALFTCVGFHVDLDMAQLKTRLKRYIDRHGKIAVMRKFLSHYVFNFVWFHIGESFRAESTSCSSFEEAMAAVDEICRKTVVSALASCQLRNRPLDRALAERLVLEIEQRLHSS